MEICVAKEGAGSVMGTDLTSVIGSLDFRVLIEFDEDYNVWAARCIDTNAVATGATPEEAEFLIKQILENDIRIAVEEGSIKNLVRVRSPFEYVERWHRMKTDNPDNVRPVILDIPDTPEIRKKPAGRSVPPELKIVSRRKGESSAA
jgi:predicted RNase H-like HicB family nuclease